jgi:DeoR family glycerol-3-phosphate regulon repressor
MNHSKKVYALIENEKFNLDGSYNFAKLEDIDTIITEEKPDKGILKILDESGINII